MCLTPIYMRKKSVHTFGNVTDTYPCGKCLECRQLRVNSWYVRLKSEMNVAASAHFVTLTYDDDNMPYSDNGLMTLNYSDVQKLWKRLRKRYKLNNLKYFVVGEYGSQTYRPHYHVIVFNLGDPQTIVDQWPFGFVHVGTVKDASIYYTLKYCFKSVFKKGDADNDDDRLRERAMMSKGLGISFITPEMFDYYHDDVSRSVTMEGGAKVPLPRYYRDKIFSEEQRFKRRLAMLSLVDKKLEKACNPLYPQIIKRKYHEKRKQLQKTD